MAYKPDWFDDELKSFYGANLYGENRLRVVFGLEERDYQGQLKYINPDTSKAFTCWILERWAPPHFFGTPKAWNDKRWFYDDIHQKWADITGPYPSRGDYVMICPLTSDGSFLPLDSTMMQSIKRKIRDDEEFADLSPLGRNAMVSDIRGLQDRGREYRINKQQEFNKEDYLRGKYAIGEGVGYSFTPR